MNDPRRSPTFQQEDILRRLRAAGVMIQLDDGYDLSELLEIGDAFLAAPVQAVVVAFLNTRSLQAITALRQRAGEHMLVGVSNILSSKDLELATAAGAQFILSPYLHPRVRERCDKLGLMYAPGVFTHAEVATALATGFTIVYLNPADILGPGHVADLLAAWPRCEIIAGYGLGADAVSAFARAGALAVMVDAAELFGPESTQTKIISAIRAMREAWVLDSGR